MELIVSIVTAWWVEPLVLRTRSSDGQGLTTRQPNLSFCMFLTPLLQHFIFPKNVLLKHKFCIIIRTEPQCFESSPFCLLGYAWYVQMLFSTKLLVNRRNASSYTVIKRNTIQLLARPLYQKPYFVFQKVTHFISSRDLLWESISERWLRWRQVSHVVSIGWWQLRRLWLWSGLELHNGHTKGCGNRLGDSKLGAEVHIYRHTENTGVTRGCLTLWGSKVG